MSHKILGTGRLKHEGLARDAYLCVQANEHQKVKLTSQGFVISSVKPFMGTSIDDIRRCACECEPVIVEYKCPMKQKDENAKEAFLSPEIDGCLLGDTFHLDRKAKYF